MTIAKEPNLPIGTFEDIVLPTKEIYSNEPPLETQVHLEQMMLLIKCLLWLWRDRTDFYAAGNLSIYYSSVQLKTEDFRGPDFFVVLGTERKVRKSWVVWQEKYKYPNVIVEVLSPTTANVDKTVKKEIYQNKFRTPEYYWFDPDILEFKGFRLENGKYQPIERNRAGHLWSEQLGLYLGVHENFVRFFTLTGELTPTPEESSEQLQQNVVQLQQNVVQLQQNALQSEQRADYEALMRKLAEQRVVQLEQRVAHEALMRELAEQKAAHEAQKIGRWEAKLRELNIDLDSI